MSLDWLRKKIGFKRVVSSDVEDRLQGKGFTGERFVLTEPVVLTTMQEIYDDAVNGRGHVGHADMLGALMEEKERCEREKKNFKYS